MIKLKAFAYKETEWELKEINFQAINLIVGQNATGKSKTFFAIATVAKLIMQEVTLPPFDMSATLSFIDENKVLDYAFKIEDKQVVYEELLVDNKIILKRTSDKCELLKESIVPPKDKFVVQVQRDTIKYPYFEEIMEWASNMYGVIFSKITSDPRIKNTTFSLINSRVSLHEMLGSFDKDILPKITKSLVKIGYPIELLLKFPNELLNKFPNEFLEKFPNRLDVDMYFFVENDIKRFLMFSEISNGMYRVFYILVYLYYLSLKEKARTIIIDDLGEGLDYAKSNAFSKYVIEFCKTHNIQLFVSSNDSFIMDNTPLEYWNILVREKSKVYAINPKNNPQIFNDFKMTGLSPFDLFASDFLNQYLKEICDD